MFTKYDGELLLTPCPTVLVTSKHNGRENVFTVSWIGVASSHPEHVCIAINTKRLSYSMIKVSKKFCIGIPNKNLLQAVDYCGNNSGRDVDKFKECNLSKTYLSDFILINECKMNVLCDVMQIIDLGSHSLFIAKVREKYTDVSDKNNIYDEINPIVYYRPYYYEIHGLTDRYYGFTIDTTKTKGDNSIK